MSKLDTYYNTLKEINPEANIQAHRDEVAAARSCSNGLPTTGKMARMKSQISCMQSYHKKTMA